MFEAVSESITAFSTLATVAALFPQLAQLFAAATRAPSLAPRVIVS
jgi:hypothetical protein